MNNIDIASALDELADLYELDGANFYRVNAYRQAAQVVRGSTVSVEELAREGKARELPGIGETLQAKILALVDTGEISAASKLTRKWPEGLVEVMKLPGVGAKTAAKLHTELEVSDLDELRNAAEAHELRKLPGFGAKSEENILDALKKKPDRLGDRILLSKAMETAEEILDELRSLDSCTFADAAGSLRRMADTCHDVDLVAASTKPDELIEAVSKLPQVAEVVESGGAGITFSTHTGVEVDLRVGEPECYGNLLQHFTGSKAHNIALRELAVGKGLHLSEYGIKDEKAGTVRTYKTEGEIYSELGLDYIEPELRENTGEIEAAARAELPDLIGYEAIQGDLHVHTTLSDGRDSLEDMVKAAKARGLKYLAITDHSATHGFGDDVSPDKLKKQIELVHSLDKKTKGMKLLAGSEVNIMADGALDYEDQVLSRLDWVIACVHTAFRMGRDEMTERIVTAIKNPLVDAFAHPTGRLLLERDPYDVDLERVIECAAETGTMLEINANSRRRDLTDRFARRAAEAGAMIVINTDAHAIESLDLMHYGVATARRAWLTADDVANTRTWREFSKLRKHKAS